MAARSRRATETCLALTVAVVLADSSIVTLALPSILREYDATVFGVSWVLTAFNLVLALLILPAVAVARSRPRAGWVAGLTVFVLASIACAASGAVGTLIGARVFQAAGGALAVACAIELLARLRGSHQAAAPLWGTAGTIGIAVGPAIGGILTELLEWQSIFLLQVPLLLLIPVAGSLRPGRAEPGPGGSLDLRPEVGLALLSAGLTGALFLLVVLLTEGWGLSPIAAAATVSAIPLATYAARWVSARAGPPSSAALAGGIAIAGGLAALGVLPGASWALTLQPQLLIGIGLALALPVLTIAALGGRDPRGSRAAATIAARHAGIVAGILVLAPLLSAQLTAKQEAATDAATAALLDAPLPAETKISLAAALGDRIEAADGRLPEIGPAFDSVSPPAGDETAYSELEGEIEDQVERAATSAFSWPFLAAALMAALALIPIARLGTRTGGAPWAIATEPR
ncbi:MAG: MFS transporter [Solirubrobacterales bacterium]